MFLFEKLWLMIFTSLNLTSKSLDLFVLQTDWESKILNLSSKSCISPRILLLLFFWVLLARNLVIISFLEQISVLRNSIYFPSEAIIFLSTRVWLYVLVMSRKGFRLNPHSIFAGMSRNSLLEADARSEGEVTATGLEPRTT